jgi:hypothetical protein
MGKMEFELDKNLAPLLGTLVTQTLDMIENLFKEEGLNKKEFQLLLEELKDTIEGNENLLSPQIKGRLMEITQYNLGIDKGYDLADTSQNTQFFDDDATE